MSTRDLEAHIAEVGLVDHHTHGVWIESPSEEMFTFQMTESDRQPDSLESAMDAQLGFAVRAWCAPVLGMDAHVPAREYFERRTAMGGAAVNRAFLGASGITHLLIDTGYRGTEIHTAEGMAAVAGQRASRITRLEAVAELVLLSGTSAGTFADDFRARLRSEAQGAVGLKSIIAYRYGLDFDPQEPSEAEVRDAAAAAIVRFEESGSVRIDDPVLLRFFLYAGMELGIPIQFHIGYGDPDLSLHRCDPLLMTDFIRIAEQRGIAIMLLHCYPFHRNAGYLAQMFRNVFLDVGLAVNYTGARAGAVLAESFELAPFSKILFSSDAWGLPELTYLGAKLFRVETARLFTQWVTQGHWSEKDALRVVDMVAYQNANAAYSL